MPVNPASMNQRSSANPRTFRRRGRIAANAAKPTTKRRNSISTGAKCASSTLVETNVTAHTTTVASASACPRTSGRRAPSWSAAGAPARAPPKPLPQQAPPPPPARPPPAKRTRRAPHAPRPPGVPRPPPTRLRRLLQSPSACALRVAATPTGPRAQAPRCRPPGRPRLRAACSSWCRTAHSCAQRRCAARTRTRISSPDRPARRPA